MSVFIFARAEPPPKGFALYIFVKYINDICYNNQVFTDFIKNFFQSHITCTTEA